MGAGAGAGARTRLVLVHPVPGTSEVRGWKFELARIHFEGCRGSGRVGSQGEPELFSPKREEHL